MKLLSIVVVVSPPLGDFEGVDVGSFAEYSAAFIVILGLSRLKVCAFPCCPHINTPFFLSVVFPTPLLPPFILVERVATVAAWEVTEAASCFKIALISLSYLLVLLATTIAAYLVVVVRTVWPSTLALSYMMRSACALEFSSRDAV